VMMNKPKDVSAAAIIGVAIPTSLYLCLYIVCVGVFSFQGLREITYPVIELAKEIQFPGEFFERFESIFFIIWVMAIFNTTTMAMDMTLRSVLMIFPSTRKLTWLYMICPVLFVISMTPRNDHEFQVFADVISYLGLVSVILIPCLLFAIAKVRGVGS